MNDDPQEVRLPTLLAQGETYWKDSNAFASGDGTCYWTDTASYIRADFLQVANGEEAIAERLFMLTSGQEPEAAFYTLANKGRLLVPDYNDGDEKRSVLLYDDQAHDQGLPTNAHRRLLQERGWEALFPDLPHPRVWTQQAPHVPVPHGIAFTNLVKRSELETNELSIVPHAKEGSGHE
jgi:hypothetical protein